ncbi:hypothetical protein JXQ31_16950 [candidate division KSB1 bacterium]|nr:hypothetical protein [candidate division KSB1 bacterium]
MNIAYYITGHGYGHAVRSIEVIKELLKQKKDITVFIRTTTPDWLFKGINSPNVFYMNIRLDFGVIQSTSFKADKQQTLLEYAKLLKIKTKLVRQELDFFRTEKIEIAISDITPFAFDAAALAGIPGIAVGNFSWDWIYADYVKEFPECEYVMDDIRQSYQKASVLYKLPLSDDMTVFNKLEPAPLIARRASLSKQQARRILGLPEKEKIVLLALRENDLSLVNRDKIQYIRNYLFTLSSCRIESPNILYIPEGSLSFENILKSCDMVLSKPGYSLISECIANKIKILYVLREDFREDKPIEKALKHDMTSVRLPMNHFMSGEWQHYLDKLDNKPGKWTEYPANGADFIAGRILSCGSR